MSEREKSHGYLFWDFMYGGAYKGKAYKIISWIFFPPKLWVYFPSYVIPRVRILKIELVVNVGIKKGVLVKM